MNHEVIVERIRARSGFANGVDAERALGEMLNALGAHIPVADRELLFHSLPPEVQVVLRNAPTGGASAFDRGETIELAQIVFETLAEAMPADAVRLLQLHLPPGIAALFHAAEPPAEIAPPRIVREKSTLSTGRPGSRHPISESAPEHTLARGRPGSEHPISEAGPPANRRR